MNIFNYQKVCIPVLLLVKQKDVDPLNYNLCLVLVNRIGQMLGESLENSHGIPRKWAFYQGGLRVKDQ